MSMLAKYIKASLLSYRTAYPVFSSAITSSFTASQVIVKSSTQGEIVTVLF